MISTPNASQNQNTIDSFDFLDKLNAIYRSAISCTRSVFFDSHITTAGKCVFQSRNDVSTTKLMALCWNASIADIINRADAIHDTITQTNQNTRSTKWICSSTRKRTPCSDEFFRYSFIISLQRPISTVFIKYATNKVWPHRTLMNAKWIEMISFRLTNQRYLINFIYLYVK